MILYLGIYSVRYYLYHWEFGKTNNTIQRTITNNVSKKMLIKLNLVSLIALLHAHTQY